ncbi:ATP-binding protein [Rhizobium skierniewicense]|uniref:ATP-binding protein n=1 Tax=Rhizobium skierniewicense TaxID=984260 RepID=UPI001FAC983E|nr:ATP-binding protein [Rhizobium skierniewicense]MCI9865561.1 ATP-binding protein [Rhizobium skierniewicense]
MTDSLEIKTLPTKELFVHVLTRDIRLEEAVLDLIDNCIDGAKRLHPGNEERFDGRWVKINFSANEFSIEDNCGGISIETAQNYAFRFGRDPNMEQTPNSIGQFGVGMKRALLRFGRKFTVVSATDSDYLKVIVDVDKWLAQPDANWSFTFDEKRPRGDEIIGTKIVVERLNDDAATRFSTHEFQNELIYKLERNAQQYLTNGLAISVNKVPAKPQLAKFLLSDEILPVRNLKVYDEKSESPVHAEFLVGVSESSPMEAGWYIACNGRVIVSADQSRTTGWDTFRNEEGGLPKYHNQFSRFRGFLSFMCSDASKLPWNTMKTGVDPDTVTFQDARREMIALMRPIIDFLNKLDREAEDDPDDRPLSKMLLDAKPVAYNQASTYTTSFKVTAPARPIGPKMVTIQFKRKKAEVDKLVVALDASSARNAGELAWDEAIERYVED